MARSFLRSPLGIDATSREGTLTEFPFLVAMGTGTQSFLLRGTVDLLVPAETPTTQSMHPEGGGGGLAPLAAKRSEAFGGTPGAVERSETVPRADLSSYPNAFGARGAPPENHTVSAGRLINDRSQNSCRS